MLEFEDFFLKLFSQHKNYNVFPNIVDDIDTLVFGGNGIKAYAYCIALKLVCRHWWMLKYGHLLNKDEECVEKTKQYIKNGNSVIKEKYESLPPFIKVRYSGFTNKLINEFCMKKIKIFAGTSSGSFFSFLLSCNVPFNFIVNTMINGRTLLKNTINSLNIYNIINNSHISDIEVLKLHMENCLKKNKIPIDITFKQHYEKYGKVFICNAVCLETEQQLIMNYQTTPKMKIIDALMASSALPGIFPPINIDGYSYVDGGVALNNLLPLFNPRTSFGFMMGNPKDLNITEYYQRVTGLKKIKGRDFTCGIVPLEITKNNVFIEKKDYQDKINENFIMDLGKKAGNFINFLLNHVTKCTWEMFEYGHIERVIFIKTVYNPTRITLMEDLERDVPIAFKKWQSMHQLKYMTIILSFLILYYSRRKIKNK